MMDPSTVAPQDQQVIVVLGTVLVVVLFALAAIFIIAFRRRMR